MRERILQIIEKNSKVGIDEIAIRLGENEIDVAN